MSTPVDSRICSTLEKYYTDALVLDCMATNQSGGGANGTSSVNRPDFLRPAVRCAIEMVLAGSLILLVGLPADNTIYYGLVVTLAVIVMVVVLFWALNRHIKQVVRAEIRAHTRN